MTRPRKNHKQKKNDSSNLKSIEDIAKKFTTKIDLQKKVLEQSKMIDALNETIDTLTTELTNIKVDNKINGEIQIVGEIPDNDKLIAETQLSRLKQIALSRDLTLEETRKFEIFSKIKNQSAEPKKSGDSSTLPRDVTPRTLMSIAAGVSTVKKNNE